MKVSWDLAEAIEVTAICLAVVAGLLITKNPVCLWGLFFVTMIV